MPSKDAPPTREREQTNESLRAERHEADAALTGVEGRAGKVAEAVVDHAREQADATLGAARAKAAAKLDDAGASPDARAAARAEELAEDATLDGERGTADLLLEGEREQRRRAQASLLAAERSNTDKHLLLERALSDERLVRILTALADSMRLRDEFITQASHQLNTPLTPLALRLHSLARQAASQPESPLAQHVDRYVSTARIQLDKVTALVAELLDVARITSDELNVDSETVDFGAVVRHVAARYARSAEEAGSVVTVEAASVAGAWDQVLLAQSVAALLENAIKYGGGRPIHLQLDATAEGARLTVRDQGIGIATEDLSRIFGRFERAVSARNYGGLGLGLYTCRSIVEAMGGTVSVESELGRGSTFTVELPSSGAKQDRGMLA